MLRAVVCKPCGVGGRGGAFAPGENCRRCQRDQSPFTRFAEERYQRTSHFPGEASATPGEGSHLNHQSCSRVKHRASLVSGTLSGSSTWSHRNAHFQLELRWTVSSLIDCAVRGWDHLCGAESLRGSCAAPKRGWVLAEPRPIALSMIPSSHSVGHPPRSEDWPWECHSGGGPWDSILPARGSPAGQKHCGLGPSSR